MRLSVGWDRFSHLPVYDRPRFFSGPIPRKESARICDKNVIVPNDLTTTGRLRNGAPRAPPLLPPPLPPHRTAPESQTPLTVPRRTARITRCVNRIPAPRIDSTNSEFARSPLSFSQTPFSRLLSAVGNPGHPHPMTTLLITNSGSVSERKKGVRGKERGDRANSEQWAPNQKKRQNNRISH